MRQCFFQKGTQVKTPLGQFILAQNKLDSHYYALERIENCLYEYVYDCYSSFQDNHFLRYYTCWEEEESIVKKVQKDQNTEVKGSKKKTMNLASFLSKKKAEISEPITAKVDLGGKSKKEIQPKKQEVTVKVKAVYVQLDAFQELKVPSSVNQIKSLMALVYLLAQAVHKKVGFWPVMIPVAAGYEGTIRFVKKGKTRNQQLANLFGHFMKQVSLEEWSNQMPSIYQMYKINGDFDILGEKIHYDLSSIFAKQYEITIKVDGKKKQQKVRIIEPEVLLVIDTGFKINIAQYSVISSFNGQNTKQITLQHYIQDQIVIIGEYSNFIIKYLKTFRIK